MLSQQSENLFAKLLLIGPAFVTIIVFTSGVTDPVNVTKLLALGIFTCGLVALTSLKTWNAIWANHRSISVALLAFLAASLNSTLQSEAPFTQTFYGVYGRNNGFLLYFLLVLLVVAVLASEKISSLRAVVKSIMLAGFINLIYCAWVLAFGDFVGWSNPYGNILGTLGNPNFVGAFLGIFSSILFTMALANLNNFKYLAIIVPSLAITLFEIVKSHAIQGRVLFVFGLMINGFFFLRGKFKSALPVVAYSIVCGLSVIIGILGTLQIGPAAKYLYKESVSLRGEYWHAGLNMAKQNLFSGVGFDSYGDWYRISRRASALIKPGPDTVSNTAHNVLIDLFAFGGLPLLISYLAVLLIVVVTIIRVCKRNRNFDFIFVSLVGAWSCFQLQSFISINQVGLAVWGSILSGAIIAYGRIVSNPETSNNSRVLPGVKKQKSEAVISPGLRVGIGFAIGLLIAIPPFSADSKWGSAQESRNAAKVERALEPSYFNPESSTKYLQAVELFEVSGLTQLAHKYALEAVSFNPHSYDSWRALSLVKDSTQAERDLAISKMKKLDPMNRAIGTGIK